MNFHNNKIVITGIAIITTNVVVSICRDNFGEAF